MKNGSKLMLLDNSVEFKDIDEESLQDSSIEDI